MADMLVPLYRLPPSSGVDGIDVRRALMPEKHLILEWVKQNFSRAWESECGGAFARCPISCFIATEGRSLVGFSVYDSTAKGMFGPMGVHPDVRTRGVGAALLMAALYDMVAQGYAYAVIGSAGPEAFYAKISGAIPIEGSVPGIYRGLLSDDEAKS